MDPTETDLLYMMVLGVPFVGITAWGLYLQLSGWKIYHRIGNYSVGVTTFFWQLGQPGLNFPGPNVLEAAIARQTPQVQADVLRYRRSRRFFGRVFLSYLGIAALFLLTMAIRSNRST